MEKERDREREWDWDGCKYHLSLAYKHPYCGYPYEMLPSEFIAQNIVLLALNLMGECETYRFSVDMYMSLWTFYNFDESARDLFRFVSFVF